MRISDWSSDVCSSDLIGPVEDLRGASAVRIPGMTPIDLTARYRSEEGAGFLDGIDIVLSIQNIFNDKPSPIATTLFLDTPYDPTNYSPVGRFISLSRSEEHTSDPVTNAHIVCRLLLEKKKKKN